MKKRSLILGVVLASCLLVGCSSTKDSEKKPEPSKDVVQEEAPGDVNEKTDGAPEPEAKELADDLVWVKEAVDKYSNEQVRGYKQVNTIETEAGEKREETITVTVDLKNQLIGTKNEYGAETPIQEYFEKTKDGTIYYYTENFETKEMTRTKSSQEDMDRAIELSNNTISLDNQKVEVVGETKFEGKKVIDVLVKNDNPEYTIFNSIEQAISEELINSDATYKAMVEKSKTALVEYHIYFDASSKELVGMMTDNTISDYFNNYDSEKVKSSVSVVQYVTKDACEKVELPKEFKEA